MRPQFQTRRRYRQLVYTLGTLTQQRWLLLELDSLSPRLQRETARLDRLINHICARLADAIAYGFRDSRPEGDEEAA